MSKSQEKRLAAQRNECRCQPPVYRWDAQMCANCSRTIPDDLARARTLPNGWPHPTSLRVDENGGVNIEWCFGEPGAVDSYRVGFTWNPREGAAAFVVRKDAQVTLDETETAGRTLRDVLDEAARAVRP